MFRKTLIIGTVAAFMLTVGAIAYASIPDANGVFYGCVKADGTLIVKDDGGTGDITCGAQATKITWNRTGPQGPAGPQGATGLQGPAGTNGISGYEVIHQQHQLVIVSDQVNDSIFCPVGKIALSGGWASADRRVNDVADRPVDDGTTFRGWHVQLAVDTTQFSNDVVLDMWAICAVVAT
jgi:hypothetical protein